MAFFSRKPNKEEQVTALAAPALSAAQKIVPASASRPRPVRVSSAPSVLIAPRITEKGAYVAEEGCYVFNVREDANKFEIARAVKEMFGVSPRQVRVVRIPRKRRTTRGTNRMGQSRGGKKAYVYLKKGEKIEII